MNAKKIMLIIVIILLIVAAVLIRQRSHQPNSFDLAAQNILLEHVKKYKETEYFSGAALSISIPGEKIHNYYAGTIAHDAGSKPVTEQTLFQIGSITKSFTAALILQLEKEKRLGLNDAIAKYLPAYTKWSQKKIVELLNMTSGLPNYSNSPLMMALEYQDPAHVWTDPQLIDYAYPKGAFAPPFKNGYFYTNTSYVIAAMIIEKQTGHSYKDELTERLIKPAHLTNTYYPVPTTEAAVQERMAHGYNFNQYDNPSAVGQDLYKNNLSWAAAAGGIVASTEDMIKWVQALFIDTSILDAEQKQKLMTVISTKTGKPLAKTSATDPEGFGLGVVSRYNTENPLENMWFYEGSTLGFRAFYIYVPCNKIIVATAVNSATDSENDHTIEVLLAAYKMVIDSHPSLRCH